MYLNSTILIRQLTDSLIEVLNEEVGYRIDLIVGNKVLVEIKSVESLNDIHTAQVLTYLKLSECKLGLIMNFNVLRVKDGIKRLVNNLFGST